MTTEIAPTRWPVYGHEWAIEYLQKAMAHGRTRHAYLITGTPNIGKNTLAHAFAMALNCTSAENRPCGQCRPCKLTFSGNNPDILYAENDPGSLQLKIDAIRAVTRLVALKPYEARYRIAIFHHFDRAQPRAQDALLKTLEEAPPTAVLILMAESTEQILPTIISRCQNIHLRPLSTQAVQAALLQEGAEEEKANLLARLSGGRIGWALAALHEDAVLEQREQALNLLADALSSNRAGRFQIVESLSNDSRNDKDGLRTLLELWQTYWRDVLLLAQDSPIRLMNIDRRAQMEQLLYDTTADHALTALNATRTAIKTISNTNANVRMVLEVLFLDYPGL